VKEGRPIPGATRRKELPSPNGKTEGQFPNRHARTSPSSTAAGRRYLLLDAVEEAHLPASGEEQSSPTRGEGHLPSREETEEVPAPKVQEDGLPGGSD
jgi:hypothetical protein